MNRDPNQSGLERLAVERAAAGEARRREAAELADEGASIAKIAAVFSVRPDTVRGWLAREGVLARHTAPARMSAEECVRARGMLEDGLSYWAVGRSLGRGSQTVERNVPGFGKVSAAERGVLSGMARRLNRL